MSRLLSDLPPAEQRGRLARGRIYQIRQVYEGKVSPDDADYRQHIYACLDCRACQTACPSGVQYGAIIEAARAVSEPLNASEKTVGRAVLGSVFTRRGCWMRLDSASAVSAHGLQKLARGLGLLRVLPMRLQEMESMLGPTQGGLRRFSAPSVTPARWAGAVSGRVYRGVHHAQFFSDTNAATVRVLAANGCVVYSPPRQGCCGALQMHTASARRARPGAAQFDAFEASGSTRSSSMLLGAARRSRNTAICSRTIRGMPSGRLRSRRG